MVEFMTPRMETKTTWSFLTYNIKSQFLQCLFLRHGRTQCQLNGLSDLSWSKDITFLVGSGELRDVEIVEELSALSALSSEVLSLISSLVFWLRRERERAISKSVKVRHRNVENTTHSNASTQLS